MSLLKIQYDQFIKDGFDKLGAIVMVIDGCNEDERYEPTVELLEEIGYKRSDAGEVGEDEFLIKTPAGSMSEKSMRAFFVKFKIGKLLLQYQPLNRFIVRGKQYTPHRPESDFRFADWYPVKPDSKKANAKPVVRRGMIEDQIADDFPNAAMAAQFLHEQGFKRSNRYKRLPVNTYFVAARHGDGQASGVVFRGEKETYYFDFYSDARYVMGASGLLKDHADTKRQLRNASEIVAMNILF
ncbi:hypothetical protein SH528x_001259 [Novipirellula sp. SH528]|uniref:hypothetical protein n=1 Tax=Novipirellula sp. SH528 TaxID=3454466 RepID=UPI003FA070BF